MVAAEDEDEVDPPFGEEVAGMPVDDFGSSLLYELKLVEKLYLKAIS